MWLHWRKERLIYSARHTGVMTKFSIAVIGKYLPKSVTQGVVDPGVGGMILRVLELMAQ